MHKFINVLSFNDDANEIEAIIQRYLEIWPQKILKEEATVPCQIMEVNMAENLTAGCH